MIGLVLPHTSVSISVVRESRNIEFGLEFGFELGTRSLFIAGGEVGGGRARGFGAKQGEI